MKCPNCGCTDLNQDNNVYRCTNCYQVFPISSDKKLSWMEKQQNVWHAKHNRPNSGEGIKAECNRIIKPTYPDDPNYIIAKARRSPTRDYLHFNDTPIKYYDNPNYIIKTNLMKKLISKITYPKITLIMALAFVLGAILVLLNSPMWLIAIPSIIFILGFGAVAIKGYYDRNVVENIKKKAPTKSS